MASSAATNYVAPGISVTSLSSQAVSAGPGPQGVLCLIGTAPKGTNQPKQFNSLADAVLEYGSASDASFPKFNLEPALEIAFGQAGVFNSLSVIGIRAGATLGTVNVPQISGGGTAYSLTAQPKYAGQNNLQAVVSAAAYGANTFQQSLSLYDNSVAAATIIETYTGTSPVSLNNQINAQSALMSCTTAGGSGTSTSNNFGQSGTYTLSGALDGSAASDTDYQNAIALAQTIDCDFIVALSGSAAVQQNLYSHVLSMIAALKYREGFIGPSYTGVSAAQAVLNAQALSSLFTSQYMCVFANSGGIRRNPATGVNTIYDGFMWAAGLGAIKAMNNPAVPLTRKPVNGLLGLTEHFSTAQLNAMAAQGIMALNDNPLPILIWDGVDAVQQPSNYYKENIVAQENRLIKIILNRVQPLIGTADPNNNARTIKQTVVDACNSAIQQQIIVAIDPTQVTVSPTSTTGVYNVNIVYQPRAEISRLNFFLTLNLTLSGTPS